MSFGKSHGTRALAAVALGFCLLLAGCGSKVSNENLQKIKAGQTQAEVEAILGTGTITNSGGVPGVATAKQETWTDGDKQIVVTYANDKVVTVNGKGL